MTNGAKIRNSSTPVRTNRNGETIVCNQYFEQGWVTSEAIKKLDEKLSKKLDQLIKLLQPPAFPGRMRLNIAFNFHDFTDLCYPSQLSNKSEEMAGKRNNDDYATRTQTHLVLWTKNCSARASHFLVPLGYERKETLGTIYMRKHKINKNQMVYAISFAKASKDVGCLFEKIYLA